MAQKVHPLDRLLKLEGIIGATIPYLGYVEVNLQIPGIMGYNENTVLLVILTTTYAEKVPVVVGSKIINKAMGIITKGELAKATMTWRQANSNAVMSRSLQLPLKCTRGKMPQEGAPPTTIPNPSVHRKFNPHDVKGTSIPHEGHHSSIWDHEYPWPDRHLRACMWVHVLTEPVWGPQLPVSIALAATYGRLHLESSWVPICLRKLGAYPIVVPAKVTIRKVTLANQVPLVTLPMGISGGSVSGFQKDCILDKLYLQGLEDWPENKQRQARELLARLEHLFAHSDLDLGKMPLIKHRIELSDQMPFKDCYMWLPPIFTMMWRPPSRKFWTLVPSVNHTVQGLVQWS